MGFLFNFENLGRKFLILYVILRFIFVSIFKGILYEKEANGFKKLVKKKNLQIVDIGTNDGLSTAFFVNNFVNSKILLFEPLKFKYKIKDYNLNKLKFFNIALGKKNSVNIINIPYFKLFNVFRFDLSAYSTINPKKKKIYEINPSLKTFYFYKNLLCERRKINIKKLDDFKLKPNIIKLDVEGFEDEVIEGARKTIKLNKPLMYIERPTKKTIKFFKKKKYSIFIFDIKKKKFIKVFKTTNKYRNYYFVYNKNIKSII